MPEQNYRLCKWYVVTDKRDYVITEKQKDSILVADSSNARFVQIDDAVLNIAFIKEIYRKCETRNSEHYPLLDEDKKFLVAKKNENTGILSKVSAGHTK